MRRSYQIAIVTATVAISWACCWYAATPRTGSRAELPSAPLVSIDISISDQTLAAITNTSGLRTIMEMLRSGRSVELHKCKSPGVMVLHFSDGESLRVGFRPGHHFLRYEFETPGGLFAVSRSRFVGTLRAAGVDVHNRR